MNDKDLPELEIVEIIPEKTNEEILKEIFEKITLAEYKIQRKNRKIGNG